MPEPRMLPSGTVTFLVTDIEGSTRALRSVGQATWTATLAAHDAIIDAAAAAHGGALLSREGDGCIVVFPGALAAARCALDIQLRLRDGPGVAVRMGLHSGEVELVEGRYVSVVLHEACRIGAVASGGQILLSGATRSLLDPAALPPETAVAALGRFRLRDLAEDLVLVSLTHPALPRALTPPRAAAAKPAPELRGRTRFVGRVEELRTLDAVLGLTRLLTLTGPGGVGKTRLAGELVARVADRFPDGLTVVELAAVGEGDAVLHAVLAAAGTAPGSGAHPLDALADTFLGRRCLLVLDNCEHVLDPVADLVDHLMTRCPDLVVITTSRESLDLADETVWPVPPLALAEGQENAAAADAVGLFLDRTSAANPAFRLTASNTAAVTRLCALLDGLPLALELAAARMRVLSADQLLARLDSRLEDLRAGRRTSESRHQTLRALLDWSYDLLEPREQWALRRLSVFPSGFGLAAAQAVCSGAGLPVGGIENLLDQLVRKSLVTPVDGGGFRLLETVRHYGLVRLREAGECAEARARQLSWVTAVVTRRDGESEAAWYARQAETIDDIRAAFAAVREQGGVGGPELVTALGSGLWRDQAVVEARSWIEAVLQAHALAPVWTATQEATVLAAQCRQGWKVGDLEAAETSARAALELLGGGEPGEGKAAEGDSAEGDSAEAVRRLLLSLSSLAIHDDRLTEAEPLCRSLVALPGSAYLQVGARNNLGIVLAALGRTAESLAVFTEALGLAEELGAPELTPNCLVGTAFALLQRGSPLEAVPFIRRALTLDVADGDVDEATESLVYTAMVAVQLLGKPDVALQLITASLALLSGLGLALPPFFRHRWLALRDDTRGRCGEAAAELERAAAAWTLDTACTVAGQVLDAAEARGGSRSPDGTGAEAGSGSLG